MSEWFFFGRKFDHDWTELVGKENSRHSAFSWHNTDNFRVSRHWILVWGKITSVWLWVSSRNDFDVILKHHGTSIGYTINTIKWIVGLQLTFGINKLLAKWQVVYVMRDIKIRTGKWIHIMDVDMICRKDVCILHRVKILINQGFSILTDYETFTRGDVKATWRMKLILHIIITYYLIVNLNLVICKRVAKIDMLWFPFLRGGFSTKLSNPYDEPYVL